MESLHLSKKGQTSLYVWPFIIDLRLRSGLCRLLFFTLLENFAANPGLLER